VFGENYGTGTLAKSLKRIAEDLYFDMDDGVPWSELVDDARSLMEGAIVLWETMVKEANE
jgi:hypothetical protein